MAAAGACVRGWAPLSSLLATFFAVQRRLRMREHGAAKRRRSRSSLTVVEMHHPPIETHLFPHCLGRLQPVSEESC